jgi:hypothetical protein
MVINNMKRNLKEDRSKIVEIFVGILTAIVAINGYAKFIGNEYSILFEHIYLVGLSLLLIFKGLFKHECVLCMKRKPALNMNVIADERGNYVPVCRDHLLLLKFRGAIRDYRSYDGERFIVPEDSTLRR